MNVRNLLNYLKPPKIKSQDPEIRLPHSVPVEDSVIQMRHENEIGVAEANYYLLKDATQKNLNLAFASLVISTFAVVVAILAVVVALSKD